MSDSHATWQQALMAHLEPPLLAELHGLLCGLLCTDPVLDPVRWSTLVHTELAQRQAPNPALAPLLEQWREVTATQLRTAPETFTPRLPSDDAPLRQRTEALGAWCQGWLYGLGLSLGSLAHPGTLTLSEESREFLEDAAQIARVDPATAPANEAGERDYAELVEYLRVGLLLILEDTRRAWPHADSSSAATTNH